jgi:hypothetical protein
MATSAMKRIDLTLILLLFVVSFVLYARIVAPTGFEGLYGQDSFAYYDFANQLRQLPQTGQLSSAFFWPLGYPALLAISFALFGTQAFIGQTVNLILGALLPPLVFLLVRQIGGGRVSAVLSGIVMLLCGQAIQSSIVLMSDIPALAWATLSAVSLLRYLHTQRSRWIAFSAVLLALAIITRWLYLALIPVWGVAVLLTWKRAIRWRDGLMVAAAAGLVFLPQLVYSRNTPTDPLEHAWVEGWSPANALTKEFTNIDGHFVYEKVNAVYYAQPFYDPYYISPLFAPFLLIGALSMLWRRKYVYLALLLGWVLLPYLFLAGIPYQNIRFPLITFPAVAILAGIGLEAAWRRLEKSVTQRRRDTEARSDLVSLLGVWAIRGVLAAILVVGIVQMWKSGQYLVNMFIANQQRDRQTAEWTAQYVPQNMTLYTFGLTLTLQHYTTLNVYELFYETPATLDARWAHGKDDYLLLNVGNIEQQWNEREVQTVYHWLRDVRGLVKLGQYGSYTLFRVQG